MDNRETPLTVQYDDSADDAGKEQYPVEPRYHPANRVVRRLYDFMASARLAMVLLVVILACCVMGATVWREAKAGEMIFGTLWFNGLLILLVINVACCFFGRIWGRRLTVVSFGMILFHLSFVAVFIGIVFNSLFCFRGVIRLTEGETLPNGDASSYEKGTDVGRFFSFDTLAGTITLNKMHTGFTVEGKDKRVAYEIAVGQPGTERHGMVYITHKLSVGGADYFNEKEGYAPLLTLADRNGQVQYGTFIPLQSLKTTTGEYLYTTGTRTAPGVIPFPNSEQPRYAVQLIYMPSKLAERRGEALLKLYPLDNRGEIINKELPIEKKVSIGESVTIGDHLLSVKEVRYWAAMLVRYEPGKPFVLGSLWVGLAGMVITTAGRLLRARRNEAATA